MLASFDDVVVFVLELLEEFVVVVLELLVLLDVLVFVLWVVVLVVVTICFSLTTTLNSCCAVFSFLSVALTLIVYSPAFWLSTLPSIFTSSSPSTSSCALIPSNRLISSPTVISLLVTPDITGIFVSSTIISYSFVFSIVLVFLL